MVKSSH